MFPFVNSIILTLFAQLVVTSMQQICAGPGRVVFTLAP